MTEIVWRESMCHLVILMYMSVMSFFAFQMNNVCK